MQAVLRGGRLLGVKSSLQHGAMFHEPIWQSNSSSAALRAPERSARSFSAHPAQGGREQLNKAEIPLCGTPLRFAPWLGGRTHACTRPSRSPAYLALRWALQK